MMRSSYNAVIRKKHLVAGALIAAALGMASPGEAQTAEAVILSGIEIDGDLGDWPAEVVKHQITSGPDANFMVGYSPEENLLYVAVEVADDDLVIGRGWTSTDACEVYTHGGEPSSGILSGVFSKQSLPVQYSLVPGPGEYIPGRGNPDIYTSRGSRNIGGTRTRTAHQYADDTIRYEWALEVHEHFPDKVLALAPGKTIGFDVVIVDKDSSGPFQWRPWGSSDGQKYSHPSRVARCVLVDRRVGGLFSGFWGNLGHVCAGAGKVLLYGLVGIALVAVAYSARNRLVVPVDVGQRLSALEKRMTETQDVLIALSEKYDRLDGQKRGVGDDQQEV